MGLMLSKLFPGSDMASGYEQKIVENTKYALEHHEAYKKARGAKVIGTKGEMLRNIVRPLCRALELTNTVVDRTLDPDARVYLVSPFYVDVPGTIRFDGTTDGDYVRVMKNLRQFINLIRAEYGNASAQTGWAVAFLMPANLDTRTRIALHKFRKDAEAGKLGIHVILVDMRSHAHLMK